MSARVESSDDGESRSPHEPAGGLDGSPTAPTSVTIEVLGPLRIGGERADTRLRSRQQRAIVGLLVERDGEPLDRSQLTEELWPIDLDEDGLPVEWPPAPTPDRSATISSYCSGIRSLVGEQAFPRATDGLYRFVPTMVRSDLVEFRRLAARGDELRSTAPAEAIDAYRAALDLWRGDPFGAMAPTITLELAAERVSSARVTVRRSLHQLELDHGHRIEALQGFVALTAEPAATLEDFVWRVRAHWMCGSSTDALAAFDKAKLFSAAHGYPMPEELDSLVRAIEDGTALPVSSAGGRTDERSCPYRGLDSFDVADRDLFHGREHLTAQLIADLLGRGAVTIAGPSGSGKSSVMRAGLIAGLRDRDDLRCALLSPGEDPVRSMRTALEAVGLTVSMTDDGQRLRDDVDLWLPDQLGPHERLVVAVDQFEEVFTRAGSSARERFLDGLLGLGRHERVLLVLCCRADFVGHCADRPELARLVSRSIRIVGPPSPDELRRAIELPAAASGTPIERGLVNLILEDAAREPGALPLVSLALAETWAAPDRGCLEFVAYQRSGGVATVIATVADRAFDLEMTDAERRVARQLLLSMVSVSQTGLETRQALATDRFGADPVAARAVQILIDARLLTVSEESVELAHEALIHRWPRLSNWVRQSRADLELERRLRLDAHRWALMAADEASRRRPGSRSVPSDGLLYVGRSLDEAQRWIDERDLPEPDIEAFVARGQMRSRREVRLRGGLVAVTVLGGLVLLAAISALGGRWYASENRRDAEQADKGAVRSAQVLFGTVALDETEVSASEYATCQKWACQGERTLTAAALVDPPTDGDRPVNYVTAGQAEVYCEWIGRRLPSSAELLDAAADERRRIRPQVAADLDRGDPFSWREVDDDDRTEGEPKHLAGNAQEWTSSRAEDPDGPPWSRTEPGAELLVSEPSRYIEREPGEPFTFEHRPSSVPDPNIGFRCAADR